MMRMTWLGVIGIALSVWGLPFQTMAQKVVTSSESGVQNQSPPQNGTKSKTWKALAELSAEEKVSLDLRTDAPRDAQFSYLLTEKFPFTAPYTADRDGNPLDGVSALSVLELYAD